MNAKPGAHNIFKAYNLIKELIQLNGSLPKADWIIACWGVIFDHLVENKVPPEEFFQHMKQIKDEYREWGKR